MGSLVETTSKKPWVETPLHESPTLSRAAGCRVFLKLENLQPSGSFKSRGIGNLVLTEAAYHKAIGSTRPLHFFSCSAGNAGLAAVSATSALGYASTVVVPENTEETIIEKLKINGANNVVAHGSTLLQADQYLKEVMMPLAEAKGEIPVYVPPFDNEAIWEGAATMVEEIHRQMPDGEKPDAIVCSVGGGGLLCGIANGMDRVGWGSEVQVLAVETKGADSLHQSYLAGRLVTMSGITSIATSLGVVRVCQKAFDLLSRKNVTSLALEDAEAAMGCWRLADDERMIVEPACGVSVALAYDGRLKKLLRGFSPDKKVVIVVCGGSKVSVDTLVQYKARYAARAKELAAVWSDTSA
ncbi:catabolic L-serine/threonine dehydratase [Exophiala dermatitidis]|uniref:L-serine ammonia-lyase n=1 Tax=Exophiala dermatitidis TaxID=5970 RepID=A0AAN6IR39_EXODE|nr:catabolic L-serine/threonine dehydratase [Exophiala dermatitidis]KAJ4505904.1 catabolic L-serine/threonine dehydratase [Exophiala dermatitidis]KAJ4506510.1 catabolic L-serine/threonine dehydratase [Exophiala dermatitidis]KAJ4533695.1 catabolic L-serine/threonine dehydratase [Exophiala dermatitidis]KAJ4539369.1 catabolic L-serine/threonine dehydratase [Exophiala dermatitidis]